jgi:hypothetical protein
MIIMIMFTCSVRDAAACSISDVSFTQDHDVLHTISKLISFNSTYVVMLVFQDHKITQLATHNRYHTASNMVLITSLPLPALAASIRVLGWVLWGVATRHSR